MIYTITARNDGRQLREYLSTELALSRRIITRLKKNERGMLINGVRVTVRAVLRCGDALFLALEDCENDVNEGIEGSKDAASFILPRLLYEDGDIMALNKPCNMPTHPSRNHLSDSLANEVCGYFADKGVPFVFRPVNRLDSGTSGAVLIAKNQRAAKLMSGQLMSGRVKKSYIALLRGKMYPRDAVRGETISVTERTGALSKNEHSASEHSASEIDSLETITRKIFGGELAGKILENRPPCEVSGKIRTNIRRKKESIIEREVAFDDSGADNSAACTRYRIIAQNERATLVLAEPVTGRTHQLRVHFAHTGHNIIGDTMYFAHSSSSCGENGNANGSGSGSANANAAERPKTDTAEAIDTAENAITRQALHAAVLTFDALRDTASEGSETAATTSTAAPAITVYAPVADDIVRLIEKHFDASQYPTGADETH